jgi:hypothetical protein
VSDSAPAATRRTRAASSPSQRQGRRPVAGAGRPTAPAGAGESAGVRSRGSRPPRRLDRLTVRPDISGPRVRVGILWFFVAMAAATAGRWPSGILWAVVAGVAAREVLAAWTGSSATGATGSPGASTADGDPAATGAFGWVAACLAAAVPLAAAVGVGAAGAALVLVTLVAWALGALSGEDGPNLALVVAVVLPAVAAGAVVVVVASQLWAGLFLILAVSMYDAGNFVSGAEASSRVEGPVTGILGVLAVTFTMATFQAPPFDTASAWIVGGLVAVACPVGQWVTSAFLPRADARAPALRRLDAYLVAAPIFLAGVWAVS